MLDFPKQTHAAILVLFTYSSVTVNQISSTAIKSLAHLGFFVKEGMSTWNGRGGNSVDVIADVFFIVVKVEFDAA